MVSGSFLDFGYTAYPGPSNVSIIDQNGKRERTKFNDAQLQQLEQTFRRCQYPQGHDREQLATRLGLTETKVQVWFKNRRAKQRANDKFEKLRQESALAQVNGSNNKRLNGANNSNSHSNGENINMSGNSITNSISSSGSAEFLLSSLDGKADGLLSPHSILSKSTFGVGLSNNMFNNNNNFNGIKDEMHGSVGETEDENEGSTPVVVKKQKAIKSDSETSAQNAVTNFPVSMPMIPMPASGFDIKSFDAVSAVAGGNAASINAAAAAATAAAMLEPSSMFFPPTAAAMAAAAAASNSPPSSSTNLWNFPYQNAYSQTTTQMFGCNSAKSFAAGSEFISSMAAASSFPLSHPGWMTTPNYTSSAMLNMNMITPTAYGFPTTTPNAHSPTTGIGATNAGAYYPSMPPSVSIAAAYDLYNQQAYYSSSTNSLWDPIATEKHS